MNKEFTEFEVVSNDVIDTTNSTNMGETNLTDNSQNGVNHNLFHTSQDLKSQIEEDGFEFEIHTVSESIVVEEKPKYNAVNQHTITMPIPNKTTPVVETSSFDDIVVDNSEQYTTAPIPSVEVAHVTHTQPIETPSAPSQHTVAINEAVTPNQNEVSFTASDINNEEINNTVEVNETPNEVNTFASNINIISNEIVKEISVKEEELEQVEHDFGQVNIMVIGIGDSGCTTINTLYELNNKEVTTVSMHVSAQMISSRYADKKFLIGENIFHGHGSDGNIESMIQAFDQDTKKIRSILHGVDMLFITGDFGTDIGSVGLLEVAKIAKEQGILTIGFPKILRRSTDIDTGELIDKYLPQFKEVVDSTVVIDDNVLYPKVAKFNLFEAVMYSDNMLISGIRGIYELITRAGKINLDYADIKTAFANRGDAILGCGKASGEHLVVKAIEDAFKSEVLDLASVKNAQTIIFNISCASKTVTIDNANEATNYIYSLASNGQVKQLFFGYTIDETLGDEVKVTFVAAGTTPSIEKPGDNINVIQPKTIIEKEVIVNDKQVDETEKIEIKSKPRFFDF